MGYWGTRGARGNTLEELINMTNELYRGKGLAIIQKVPTPITPVNLDRKGGKITLAYFDKKSTVDYIGAVQGVPICFDAKETAQKNFPLKNVHLHQLEFMEQYQNHKGIAFLLVHFTFCDEYYVLEYNQLKQYWDAAQKGGRKSIPYEDFDKELKIENKDGFYIHYLRALQVILERE